LRWFLSSPFLKGNRLNVSPIFWGSKLLADGLNKEILKNEAVDNGE
jgi:hypothetical protein